MRAKLVRITYASPATRAWRDSCFAVQAGIMTGRGVRWKRLL